MRWKESKLARAVNLESKFFRIVLPELTSDDISNESKMIVAHKRIEYLFSNDDGRERGDEREGLPVAPPGVEEDEVDERADEEGQDAEELEEELDDEEDGVEEEVENAEEVENGEAVGER